MFDQTKSMFARWLQYGIGTMFSLAVLSFTVTVAMKMVGAVAANFAAQYMTMMALGAGDSPGVNTMALQQGGLGMFLTVLILSVPPMASSFFQGVLGSFTHYSAFGANSAPNSSAASGNSQYSGHPPGPGSPGYTGQAPTPPSRNPEEKLNGNVGKASPLANTHAADTAKNVNPVVDTIKRTPQAEQKK